MNISIVSDEDTARTNIEAAIKRAENMACLSVKSVLELCVGPSFKALQAAYGAHGIRCAGNDIDYRWQRYYQSPDWVPGNALQVTWYGQDGLVFAPPLSAGCTGTREDSLSIDDVKPSYRDFLKEVNWRKTVDMHIPRVLCLVLPARSLSTRQDRSQFYALLNEAKGHGRISVDELKCGRREIRKYVDLYIERF